MEINADLSCDFLSSHTIQNPVRMCYDEDTLQIRLSKPLLSFDDPSHVRQKWHRQSLLGSLNEIMHDYGCVQSVQCFSTFKFILLSVCNASAELFRCFEFILRKLHIGCGCTLFTLCHESYK